MTRKSKLTDATRDELARVLADGMLDTMFGDGMEAEYVWDGFPAWGGVNNLTDAQLVKEYAEVIGDEDNEDEPDELLERARAELRAGRPARRRKSSRR